MTRRGLLAAAGASAALAAYGYGLGRRPGERVAPEALAWLPTPSRSARTKRTPGSRRLLADTKLFTEDDGNRRQDQHLRPRPLPGADQQLPAGPPGRRLHVVRRLPDAVLRGEGPRDADRRRLEDADAADAAGLQGRLDRRSTGTSTSCRTRTTRGPCTTGRACGRRRATPLPKTWAQFIALAKKMQADGLTPIAFTDKDGWPPMGTFDILNMRINGYEFHVDLMAGKQSWDSPQVKAVFKKWTELFPYYSEGALGLTWQDGAAQLENKQAGMFLLGGFLTGAMKPANAKDIDFFPFPVDQPEVGAGLDRRPDRRLHDLEEARRTSTARRSWSGSSAPPRRSTPTSRSTRATSVPTSTRTRPTYSPLQKKEAKLIAATKHIAQYMDRDTRPDFASTVMIPSLQSFLNKPGDYRQARARASRSRRRRSSDRELVASRRDGDRHRNERESGRRAQGESAPSASRPVTASRWRSWSGSP